MQGVIRLGTQGWNYAEWVGPFYPNGTAKGEFLRLCSRAFDTVEVDASFYAIPSAATLGKWAAQVPEDFVFALKMPQEVTHVRRCRTADVVVRDFETAVRSLGPRLGPILIQLPPSFAPHERAALEGLLGVVSTDLRYAVEFRGAEWMTPSTMDLLRAHGVALALTDARWIPRDRVMALAARPTASFAYVRWMGDDRSIVDYGRLQIDRSHELRTWARVIPALSAQVDAIFGYVNNHFAGHAPATLRALQSLLGLPMVPPGSLGEQIGLFPDADSDDPFSPGSA
jgi:uncharacterized protein YecE (DUF72 family)